MKFNNQRERELAIEKACRELGEAYGQLKFREHMFREVTQSYVPDVPYTGKPGQVTEVKEEPKPKKETKKKASKKTKVEKVESEEELPGEEKVTVEATECPISTVEELRQYMTDRYMEAGKTPEAMTKIRGALEEATGKTQVAELDDEQIPVAYDAISKVEL